MVHRAVPAAEKYAEVGDDRPRCECHGELMLWDSNARRSLGGIWRCPEAFREKNRRYRASPAGQMAYQRRVVRERLGLIQSSTERMRNTQIRRDLQRIEELKKLLGGFNGSQA